MDRSKRSARGGDSSLFNDACGNPRSEATHCCSSSRGVDIFDPLGTFERQASIVTPSGDFLYFSARRSGIWELHRVHGWSTDQPVIDHLQLSGYFSSRDKHNLEQLSADIFVTPDGAHAACVGTAVWLKRVNGRAVGKARTESFINVIDLRSFKIVNTAKPKTAGPFEFQSVEMDEAGHIVIERSSFGDKASGEFTQLDVPSLIPSARCSYDWINNKQQGQPQVPVAHEDCTQALHSVMLGDYLKSLQPYAPVSSGFTCVDTKAEYCPQPDTFTKDKRVGLGIRTEGHDELLGGWVETRSTAVLFSTATHKEVGQLDLTHQRSLLKLASVNGQDYLLLLKSDSELSVYQIIV